MVCCVHHIPGRARFKVEALRRDPQLVEMIEVQVGALKGVYSVEVNRHAASIVVHYCTEQAEIDRIMDHICTHCPMSSLNRRSGQLTAPPAAAHTVARTASPRAAHAVREAASKAVVNTFITRAIESSLAGIVGAR